MSMRTKKRTNCFENLLFSMEKDVLRSRMKRPLFYSSPKEREINVLSKSGRVMSDIEVLQYKHQPEFEQLVPSVADALEAVMQQHATVIGTTGDTTDPQFKSFDTSQKPKISMTEYVWRIAEYTYTSPSTLLTALIYIDRLLQRFDLLLTQMNLYKIFFVSVRVASKVVDLRTLNNKNFAGIGGVNNRHLNDLEALYVTLLQFDLFVSPIEFRRYAARLEPTPEFNV